MPKKLKLLLLLFIPVCITAIFYHSCRYPHGYYGNPLDIPVELAANFGEVRADHFHMGLDIRTNGKENLPVYAAADGFISRATIEEASFGKAVYITHPNGAISVYGHLNSFMPALEKLVKEKQYVEESWLQDVVFTAEQFPVKKGMLIAYSGNTGASEGPHLHFEIRGAATGNNLNPLLNGFGLKDNIAPVIQSLYLYDATKSLYETDAGPVAIKAGEHEDNGQAKTVTVSKPCIRIGIEVAEKNADNKYHLGIYKAMLYMDEKPAFYFVLDSMHYSDTRYVNACIDYAAWFGQAKCIQLLYRLPGNKLSAYNVSPGDGVLHLEDRKMHHVKIVACDAAGNTATVDYNIVYNGAPARTKRQTAGINILAPCKKYAVKTHGAEAFFNNNTLYDTVPFAMHEEPGQEPGSASNLVCVHYASVPVHTPYILKIKTTLAAGSSARGHVVMRLANERHCYIVKGRWQGDYMTGSFTEFGNAQLLVDTSPPDIQCEECDNNTITKSSKALHILYKDNAGSAAYFNAKLDGHWLLFEKKGDMFTYYFDEHCLPGRHCLVVTVKDIAGNICSKTFTFNR